MMWIYAENDSYFGPELTKRMHAAFAAAGGNAEYRQVPPFGGDGHFMIDSPDAVAIWSPLVSAFLAKHSATSNARTPASGSPSPELQTKPPQLHLPQEIQYSGWRKLCFESSDGTTICRITSTGTEDLDQVQVVARVDLIQRADGPARLQLFVPQGADLQRGVNVAVDQGQPTKIPFTWCLSNICIAAAPVEKSLIAELESGKTLKLELTDLASSAVALTLSLDQFAAARSGAAAQTFEFGLDEE
jgi:invasion protein IalB